MTELDSILKPSWGSEQWIMEGWQVISQEDRQLIKSRVNELFQHGLPFKLHHDKIIYIYAFSLLAQLEVLAIQIPLKFGPQMSTEVYRKRMHHQLLDEIFHGIVFTKILFLLCEPYATPPAYNENIEILCNFIRQESCPKVALMLLNLIGEGWIEEIFYSLKKQGVAPKVFSTIIDDEHRHVCEADLYKDIGLADMNVVTKKLKFLEEQLLTNVFMQYNNVYSLCTLLGVDGSIDFVQSLNKKHLQQLQKINLEPSPHWHYFMKLAGDIIPKIKQYSQQVYEVEMTQLRKIFMTQWGVPNDPTMCGEFDIIVSAIDFFGKKFPPETITTLMLQAISLSLKEATNFRYFLNQNKLYCSQEAYVGLVVKLPDCADHIGTIVFENCHHMSIPELATKIRFIVKLMSFCFNRRTALEQQFPHLKTIADEIVYQLLNDKYPYPLPGSSIVSLSNIGFCGYKRGKSPLRFNESVKFTLLEIEKKPIWDEAKQNFLPQDVLPVSVSADHRIFDGNLPIPKIINKNFHAMFRRMLEQPPLPSRVQAEFDFETEFMNKIEQLIASQLELGYKLMVFLQTYWFDFVVIDDLLTTEALEKANSLIDELA